MLDDAETRRDQTRCKRWGKTQRKTGGTRGPARETLVGCQLTRFRVVLCMWLVTTYNLDNLSLTVRVRGKHEEWRVGEACMPAVL